MIDFQQIFRDTIAPFNGQLIGGSGSVSIWNGVFSRMRARLENDGASREECQQFKDAIGRAINDARANELTDEERTALRDILSSAFDGIVRQVPGRLAPKANFLNGVTFSN